ncbi:hypothetical protein [Sphingomonas sp. ID0503]
MRRRCGRDEVVSLPTQISQQADEGLVDLLVRALGRGGIKQG